MLFIYAAVGYLAVLALVVIVLLHPRCMHEHVRCTHGDEIIARNGRRRVCLGCGRALKGPLPEPCSVTGQPH